MSTHNQENVVWEARPSHWVQADTYLICLALAVGCGYLAFAIPGFLEGTGLPVEVGEYARIALLVVVIGAALRMGWVWLNLRYTHYVLTEKTLYTRTNWLSGDHDTLWVHLIRDVRAEMPLHLRIIGLGRVVVDSMDRTHPQLILDGIRKPKDLKLRLNEMALHQGPEHGTRVIDTGG